MRLIWAIAGGVLLAAALYWFQLAPEKRPFGALPGGVERADGAADRASDRAAPATKAPTLYRWHDDNGVVTITDRPPADRPYQRVDIPLDRNVVPMSEPAPPPED